MIASFLDNFEEHLKCFRNLVELRPMVDRVADLIVVRLASGERPIICGHDGSAADSQHLAAELWGRFIAGRRSLATMALSTDTSALMCIAGDCRFVEILSSQEVALGRNGDCFLVISISGNSPTVIRAAEATRDIGMSTLGLLSRDGDALVGLCDLSLVVRSAVATRIQEAHFVIGHIWCGMVEQGIAA